MNKGKACYLREPSTSTCAPAGTVEGGIPSLLARCRHLANVLNGDEDALLDVESQMLGAVGAPPSG